MPKITIYTQAFNAEDYIEECAKSVLNQSFSDFEWIVIDNCSSDSTGNILEKYASLDQRVKLIRNESNSVANNRIFEDIIKFNKDIKSEYWCSVDSDDYLHRDFLKELYEAAKKNSSDIVIGGTEMFLERNPNSRNRRCPPDFHIKKVEELGDMLPEVYGSFRPLWGKLISVNVVKKTFEYRKKNPITIKNGIDTIFCLDCLFFTESVTGVSKVLHYYRISESSFYHTQVNKERYKSYINIYQRSEKLLKQWGKLNNKTHNFIAQVLFGSLKDCIDIAKEAKVSISTRIEAIESIISDEYTTEIFKQHNLIPNLLLEVQNAQEKINNEMDKTDVINALTFFSYRLYKSIKLGSSVESNKQNALILYISSIFDEKNRTHFGMELLHDFLSITGKTSLSKIITNDSNLNTLLTNRALFIETINLNITHAVRICDEEHSDYRAYSLLRKELISNLTTKDQSWVEATNNQIYECIVDNNLGEAVELILTILNICPLERETLSHKLYLLSLNNDKETVVETAEILRVFYSNDFFTLKMVAQAYNFVGLKDKAKENYVSALKLCEDDEEREVILKELDAI